VAPRDFRHAVAVHDREGPVHEGHAPLHVHHGHALGALLHGQREQVEVRLGLPALGHVLDHAEGAPRPSLLVREVLHDGVQDPLLAVGPDQPELRVQGAPLAQGAPRPALELLAVGGVHQRQERLAGGSGLRGLQAEESAQLPGPGAGARPEVALPVAQPADLGRPGVACQALPQLLFQALAAGFPLFQEPQPPFQILPGGVSGHGASLRAGWGGPAGAPAPAGSRVSARGSDPVYLQAVSAFKWFFRAPRGNRPGRPFSPWRCWIHEVQESRVEQETRPRLPPGKGPGPGPRESGQPQPLRRRRG